ncbi:hypothetical protein K6W26_22870 [Burkholderia sp. AU42008]|uniref:hypothetical protein n=1 Tax=unclassified Burkholderia TaxID=2613784 RepID=UPI000B7AB533|nr:MULTISPECIES: hypothetical protein [unclassified Burkholderia]MBR8234658.1 hypothetical protein [Burkholderia sp. AU32357]MBY4875899.1 hypothetical protein [Burkholderia sp. AU42008]OXI44892.1 hypothetical protein CFB49_07490 [Burkholderia sp. AU17457]
MSKYQNLDALILAAIDETPKKFVFINAGPVRVESERIAQDEATPRTRGEVVGWRVIDRRLQALRKAGKIRSTSTGWVRA